MTTQAEPGGVVLGRVADRRGRPLAHLLVRAYDRDLRSEELLGECVTGRDGRYQIHWSQGQLSGRGKQTADLALKVLSAGRGHELYTADVDATRFNASAREEINVTIEREVPAEAVEFDAIVQQLSFLARDLPLAELQESTQHRDVSFLSREAGIAADKIEHVIVAHRVQAAAQVDADFFYALLRRRTLLKGDLSQPLEARLAIGIESEVQPLLYDAALADDATLRRDVAAAVKQRIVGPRVLDGLERNLKHLQRYRAAAQAYRQTERPRKLMRLVSRFVLEDKVAEMARDFEASKDQAAAFFARLDSGSYFPSDDHAQQAQAALALERLLGLQADTLAQIQQAHGITRPEQVRKLARLNRADWKAELGRLPANPKAGRTPDPGAADLLASSLVRRMETAYPTTAFAAQLQREKAPLLKHQTAIADWLSAHDDFDLRTDDVARQLKEDGAGAGVRDELRSLQRVFKLVPHYGKTMRLRKLGLQSAQSISAAGAGRFVREIAPRAGLSAREARDVFRKAQHTATAAMLIAGELQDTARAAAVPAMEMARLAPALQAASLDFPNLKSLFQGVDACACQHCRSVYSPAAYLVEILQFISQRSVTDLSTLPPTTARLAKDVLFARRPDLGDIDLSCENANTPVPYIDLVCELLEEAVSPDPGVAYTGVLSDGADPLKGRVFNDLRAALQAAGLPVTDQAVVLETESASGSSASLPHYLRDREAVCKIVATGAGSYRVFRLRQTLWPAAELAAAPAYVNAAAYEALKAARSAFTLPFDLDHAEARAYFARFDIPRAALMQAFQVAGSPAAAAIAAETLGLGPAERTLVTQPWPALADQQAVWNAPAQWDQPPVAGDVLAYMTRLDHFLHKTGLAYDDAVVLLKLSFIDPQQRLFVRHLDLGCDTARKEVANLDLAALDRVHRLLRLQKKTGWTLATLDEVISQPALGNGTLDGNCLVQAARLADLAAATGLPVPVLVGFYGVFPPALYEQVFLDKAKNGAIDERLRPDQVDGSGTVAAVATAIAAGLQLKERDLQALRALLPDDALDFANLSRLHAAARLLKKLKLGAEAYVLLCQMSGIDPSASPAQTVALVEAAADLARSPLDAAAIRFMLAHEAPNLAERELSDVRIEQLLAALQAEYQKNFAAHRSSFDPNRSADDQKEALSIALSRLPKLAEADVRTLVALVDRQWPSANAAKAFVDDRLGALGSTLAVKTAIDVLAAAPGPDLSAKRRDVVEALLALASGVLLEAGKQAILAQHLTRTFNAEPDLVQAVLRQAELLQPASAGRLSALLSTDALIDTDPSHTKPVLPPIALAAFGDAYRSLRLAHKLFPLIQAFGMAPAQVEWLFEHAGALGWFRWDSIPYQAGQVAVDYGRYAAFVGIADLWRRLTPVANPADTQQPVSFQTLATMLLPTSGTGRAAFVTAFALLTGLDRNAIDAVDAHLFPAFSLAAYRDPATWTAVARCASHLGRLGLTLAQVQAVIQPTLTAAETGLLRTALKARYDEDTWLGTLKEVMDAVRPLKRDALVAHLLAQNAALASENDLYDHFLVDVEMCACMPSSRIVQAHGTVQLFVQRCLMGLEHTATADIGHDPGWGQWTWMKNYRVWEANRKVFLYPENWIEPELRDDKSFLFQELENELQQNELTAFTAEQAFVRYVEKLDNIAFLEVMATWYQADLKTMHVFARTKGGDPAIYYYRRFVQERYWTPWEKVEVDISGDHLLAFVRNNRLCLVWPVFSEEPDPIPSSTIPSAEQQGFEVENDKPRRKLKMQLAISELANRKWEPKRISRDGILTPNGYYSSNDNDFRRDIYNLMYVEPSQQIWLFSTIQDGEMEYHTLRGMFDIAGCKGYPELSFQGNVSLPDFLPDFKDARLQAQRYLEQNEMPVDELAVRNAISFTQFYDVLHKTPGNFRLSYPHQFTMIDLVGLLLQLLLRSMYGTAAQSGVRGRSVKLPLGTLLPYFMEDSRHAYVIVPGFYGTQAQGDEMPVQVQRTGSDALQLIEDIVALASKYIAIYAANSDVDALVKQLVADDDFEKIVAELEVYAALSYGEQFKTLYHPLICSLRKKLYRNGLAAMMKRETQLQRTEFDFRAWYDPNKAVVPQTYWVEDAGVRSLSYPVEDLDFSRDGAYSGYNWELFFHVPMLVAGKLTKNQRFEEALAWFHHMFNPTGALAGDAPEKYWITKPFFLTHAADYMNQRIDTLLHRIADPGTPERKELECAIAQWRDKPFQPHVVARFRPVSYQKALLMKYIENLTEWGDNLFRQDTMESIVQATQMYILADKLLGPKPRTVVPPAVEPVAETYRQLEARLDAFGNALIDLENVLPDLSALPEGGAELPPPPVTLSMLYFCIPQNDRMLEVWDRIADRLYKIRHCQNIEGVERSLALFAPPIDPGMLVRAAAAGLDHSAVLAGVNAPLPYYRFTVFAQKAAELAMEVRSLGLSLLQALDKQDVEAMALLRNDLELKALDALRDTKRLHVQEAKEQIEVLKRARATMEEKRQFYAGLQKIITKEQLNLDKLGESHDFQMTSQIVQATAGVLALIPDFAFGVSGAGGSAHATAKWGGSFLAHSATAASGVLNVLSTAASYEANRASILGSYDRRFDEWQFQERLSRKEIAQIERQIVVAEIRRDSAVSDLASHDVQIENSKKSDEFMRSRFTNKELYDWMVGQLSAVYFESYQLAFEFAKKAERCYRFELGNDDTFVDYGYWDSMKKGLQSADGLIHDIKRMQTSYLEKNKREYEITKHVSLAQLDPLALVRLRATGWTDFELPEVLFDMDHPGQYFRRLKSVAISMPCVIGPYTSVSAKLSMLSNRYRRNTNPDNGAATGYTEDPGNDERFTYNVGAIQSIASSNAQNDTGLFELNFKEDRYLPFEGSGAIGSWRLELPKEVRQFNYATISDVVLHVKYTAREGGSSLRALAEQSLKDRLGAIAQQLGQTGLHVALNLRQDMASDWLQFKSGGSVSLTIDKLRLPYLAQTLDAAVEDVIFVAKVRNNPASTAVTIDGATLNLARVDDWKLCRGITPDIELGTPFTLAMAAGPLADLEDLMLVVKYRF